MIFYRSNVLNEESLISIVDELAKCITNVYLINKVKRYQFLKFDSQNKYLENYLNSMFEGWGLLYAIIGKYVYSKHYKQDSFYLTIDRLNNIAQAEKNLIRYIDSLF